MPTNENLLTEATAFYELLLGLSNDCVLADEDVVSLDVVSDDEIVARIA